MIKKARSYNLLGLLSLVLLIISLFLRQEVVDIHISDTYYVFNFTQAFVFISIILLGLFFSYHFIWKDLISKRQLWLHLSFTFITTIILMALIYNASRAYEPNFSNWDFLETNNTLLVLTLLIFAAGQIGFQIYFIFKTVQKP